ncbi:MAG: hypothetical protein M3162_04180 [Thermoproteota archaeon]|nr:hypothetical protein [Thermoproteota archaeon]
MIVNTRLSKKNGLAAAREVHKIKPGQRIVLTAFQGRTHDLVEYELFLPSHFDTDMKTLCLYHEIGFGRLPNGKRQKLVEYHDMAIKIEPH